MLIRKKRKIIVLKRTCSIVADVVVIVVSLEFNLFRLFLQKIPNENDSVRNLRMNSFVSNIVLFVSPKICVCVCVCLSLCVYVCVREREGEKERDFKSQCHFVDMKKVVKLNQECLRKSVQPVCFFLH